MTGATVMEPEKYSTHLVLLDITMRGTSGFELAHELRLMSFPLILAAVTAYTDEDWRQKCEVNGFDYFLPKPASLSALKALFAATERRLAGPSGFVHKG